MSFATHLQGDRLDVSLIQTAARNNLINLLEKCPGPKAIVWDNSLAGPMGLIAQYSVLKDHSVVKMFPLREIPLPEADVAHVIFITRPKLQLMDFLSNNIHLDLKSKHGSKKQYHVYFVPKTSLLCLERLKQNRVFGSIESVEEFKCQLFPFESDVVSMEIGEVFREYVMENDPTCLYQTAQAILFLQQLYGPMPRVWGRGPAARQVWELVGRLQREQNYSAAPKTAPLKRNCIDQILLIDRQVDLVTPLATQLTYEGLIDQIFGISNSTANFPAEHFLPSDERGAESDEKRKIILNSADQIFQDIRDKNFNAVGAYLSKQAKAIGVQLDSSQEKSVQEMKLYVQKLPEILARKQSLANHTAIAECVKTVTDSYEFRDTLQVEQEFLNCTFEDRSLEYLEDLISQGKPLIEVLRLICLRCITSSGLKPKVLDTYKRQLAQVYGLEALCAVAKLEQVGYLKCQSGTRQYTVLRKALRLTLEDSSEINPTDISYVHSVYAPLSVRLAECLTRNGGWKQLQDVLGLLPGPTLDESPPLANEIAANQNAADAPQVVLVFFIGGCTFAEISALRFLSQQEDANVEFVVATTKLINSTTFLKSIIE